MLSGRHQPAFTSSHHCQVIFQHLIWRTKPQAVLDVVVGSVLVDTQLLAAVLQTEHPQTVIKPLLVDPVLPLHLSVVAGSSDADAMVAYRPCEIFSVN